MGPWVGLEYAGYRKGSGVCKKTVDYSSGNHRGGRPGRGGNHSPVLQQLLQVVDEGFDLRDRGFDVIGIARIPALLACIVAGAAALG